MIPARISSAEGLALAKKVLSLALPFDNSAAIAGGFGRDLSLGFDPKDIDLFVVYVGPRENALVEAVYGGLGHEWMETTNTSDYPSGVFRTYQSVGYDLSDYPVNLVVGQIPNAFNDLRFPFEMSHYYLFSLSQENWEVAAGASKDNRDNTLTIRSVQDSYTRAFSSMPHNQKFASFLKYVRRMVEKFPDRTILLTSALMATGEGQEAYKILVQEGIISDPRTLFPAQAQGVAGDQVGLNDREEDIPQPGIPDSLRDLMASIGTFPPSTNWIRSNGNGGREAFTTSVRDPSQVPSGPADPIRGASADFVVFDEAEAVR